MNTKNKDENCHIGALLDFCLDSSDLSNDEIIADITKEGIDVDLALTRILKKVNTDLYGKSWQEVALENKQKMLSVGQKLSTSSLLNDTKVELLAWLKEQLANGQLQTQHRDLKELTEKDLLSLLEDVEYLRKFNESKK
jgi:hypothetical protein